MVQFRFSNEVKKRCREFRMKKRLELGLFLFNALEILESNISLTSPVLLTPGD